MRGYAARRLAEIGPRVRGVRPRFALAVSEHAEQCALIEWWALECRRHGLDERNLFAIPNAGAGGSRGQGGKMKAEGARAGVPDLLLAVARGRAHGLFIEMKALNQRARPDQRAYHELLEAQGYRVRVCQGAKHAMAEITAYLEGL